MNILAVDTAGKTAGVALLQDDRLLYECYLDAGMTHSETLMPMIDTCLKMCGMTCADIDLYGVNAGPGSFTGLRIGLAAVKGLAFPRETLCAPVSTLEALAAAFVLLLLRAAGCLPRGLGVPGAGYVLLGSAVPFLWAVLMVTLAECARIAERDEGTVCGAAFVAMLALMMVEAGLGVSGLAVLPGALAGALVALGLWAFPPARLGAGCCGSLLAAGAIGCIPLSLDMTSLTVPLALPFWAAGGLLAAQLLCAKRTGKPLRCWVKKHKMSPETVFLCSFALSAVGYVLALALLRWC